MAEEKIVRGGVEQEGVVSPPSSPRGASKETWYGASLLILLGGGFVLLVGAIGWWGYAHWYLPAQEPKASIVSLTEEMVQSLEADVAGEDASPDEPSEAVSEVSLDPKQEAVLVLNGGGTKGSAGEVATLLKQAGYSKVSPGNTEKNYTGVTVYFAPQYESAANEVKALLLKRYPKALSQKALESDQETSGASLVVIIGK